HRASGRRGCRRLRCRPPDPLGRRAAALGFPAVGERVRRAVVHRADVARLHGGRPRRRDRGVPPPRPALRRPRQRHAAAPRQGGCKLMTDASLAMPETRPDEAVTPRTLLVLTVLVALADWLFYGHALGISVVLFIVAL